ncbi:MULTISPECIES: amidohydrolase [Paenibacillus]|nr:amidohydrolase [Paenibacillus rhizosphaerae]
MEHSSLWLTHVRLETGWRYEGDAVSGTETALYHIRISEGSIAEIRPADAMPEDGFPHTDMGGALMLPAMRDMHIHLDKTYYGGPWKAPGPAPKGIFSRIEEEEKLLPKLLPTAQHRAERLIELLLASGTTHFRTHCNIDPFVGLNNLEATLRAAETYKDRATFEIVAFPQHGLMRSQAAGLVREALRSGASLAGGVDPATVDGDIEKSLNTMMELAVEADAGVDLHLHDPGHLGVFTIQRLADLTEQAGWQGRVTVSHALALADISPEEAAAVAARMADLGISVTSSVPLGRTIPIPMLAKQGVRVELGHDSIADHWSPFGKGDSLEKAGTLAERFGWGSEAALGASLGFVTGGRTPLDGEGRRVWPMPGDEASAVFVDASCSAEAVARRAARKALLHRGKPVFGVK